MLIEHLEIWQLGIVAGMLIINIIIGYTIRLIILKSKAALAAGLIILCFVLIFLAVRIWPAISYLNLAAGLIGLMAGMIRPKKK